MTHDEGKSTHTHKEIKDSFYELMAAVVLKTSLAQKYTLDLNKYLPKHCDNYLAFLLLVVLPII